MENDRYIKVLGLGEYKPNTKFVCFLPFRGEFGWYLMNFVKRIHGYNHENKIACIKAGHEALFPTVNKFYYSWEDIPDYMKAGQHESEDEEELKNKILIHFSLNESDVSFISTKDTSWDEKTSLAKFTFIPENKTKNDLKVDIVIGPRNRKIDAHRNWKPEYWQLFVDAIVQNGYSVGICGSKEASFDIKNVKHYSYNYVDVDSDIEMLKSCRLFVGQESGLAYLAYLCKTPTFIIDLYMGYLGADLHRDLTIPFKEAKCWEEPEKLVKDTLEFLNDTSI